MHSIPRSLYFPGSSLAGFFFVSLFEVRFGSIALSAWAKLSRNSGSEKMHSWYFDRNTCADADFWSVMSNGFPPSVVMQSEVGHPNQRTPFHFLEKLFLEVGGLTIHDMNQGFAKTIVVANRFESTRRAIGSPKIHFCSYDIIIFRSKTSPSEIEIKTFDLKGMQLEWRFSTLGLMGDNYALISHKGFRARFASLFEEEQFKRAWTKFFRRSPTFARSSDPVLSWESELLATHEEYTHTERS